MVLFSNDYKYFITDHHGHLLNLTTSAEAVWDSRQGIQKSNFVALQRKPWTKDTRLFIMEKFSRYESNIKKILLNSTLEIINHCSGLERLNSDILYLPLYFAIFNSDLAQPSNVIWWMLKLNFIWKKSYFHIQKWRN